MTSPKKFKANQINAQKSTGPKSLSGRQRSSKNALKHGLSKGYEFDAIQQQKALRLAQLLCAGRGGTCHLQALELAKARIELNFIQSLKREQLKSLDWSALNPLNDNNPEIIQVGIADENVKNREFENAIQDLIKILSKIRKLERYECSAKNRLQRATRNFLEGIYEGKQC